MKILSLLIFVFAITTIQSQDRIIKKGGEIIEAKILEINPNEIKYKNYASTDEIIYIIDKDRVLEVVFENGRKEKYESILTDEEFYIGQKKRAIKLNFISPLLGYTQLAYEKNIKPGRGYEISLGIIGLGKNQNLSYFYDDIQKEDQKGVFASFGYKLIRIPDFTTNNQKFGHILQGSYVKPEIMLGYFSNNVYSFSSSNIEKQKTTFGAVIINLGKQWVYSNIFVLDVYAGLGYAFQNRTKSNNNEYNYNGRLYGLVAGVDDGTFALSGGLRIGILLN